MIKKIISKTIAYIIIYFSIVVKSPKITANGIILNMRPLMKPKKNRKNILILQKSSGIDDLITLSTKKYNEFNLYKIDRQVLKIIFHKFVQKFYIPDDLNYQRFSEKTYKSKVEYREYLTKTLTEINKRINIDAIIQFSFYYRAERELQLACKITKIRFITLYKESLITRGQTRSYVNNLKSEIVNYNGDLVLVYNNHAKRILKESGVFNDVKIETIGMPRLDFLHNSRINNISNDKNTILYFLIDEYSGLRGHDRLNNSPHKNLQKMINDINETVIKIAKKYPHIQFIFKAKWEYHKQQRNQFPNKLPKNICFKSKGSSTTLIPRADVAIAYSSTTIFESIAAGLKVLVPSFSPKDNLDYNLNDFDLNKKYLFHSKDDFQKLLENYILNDVKKQRNLDEIDLFTLEEWMGNKDGISTNNLHNAIKSII